MFSHQISEHIQTAQMCCGLAKLPLHTIWTKARTAETSLISADPLLTTFSISGRY